MQLLKKNNINNLNYINTIRQNGSVSKTHDNMCLLFTWYKNMFHIFSLSENKNKKHFFYKKSIFYFKKNTKYLYIWFNSFDNNNNFFLKCKKPSGYITLYSTDLIGTFSNTCWKISRSFEYVNNITIYSLLSSFLPNINSNIFFSL